MVAYCFVVCNILKKFDFFWKEWEWGVRCESSGPTASRVGEDVEDGLRGRRTPGKEVVNRDR